MRNEYDVIVVGARVAGSTLAYRLAKSGYRVLLAEKGQFPSDVLSTHNFFNNSMAMLEELGVLDKLLATRTPVYRRAHIQMEDAVIAGEFPKAQGYEDCLCIRRVHLDNILFEHAAALEGVDAVERLRVTGLLYEGDTVAGVKAVRDGSGQLEIKARLVVGADGRHSTVRALAGSKCLHAVPTDYASYVGYFKRFRQEQGAAVELYRIGEHIAIVFPTSDDLHVVGVMFPLEDERLIAEMKSDPEAGFRKTVFEAFDERTTFASRLHEASLEGPIRGLLGYDNNWHEPMGNGWALVGDSWSFKEPAVGQGMHDAMYSAKCLSALLSGRDLANIDWSEMAEAYGSRLEQMCMPLFGLACELTRNVPISPEQRFVNTLIAAHPPATGAFLGMYNHANPPEELGRVIEAIMTRT
ncbi:MAG: monooxygenase [Paenibacillus sp.]|nr:monooxygenase [Paenibacillus sp.]